MLCSVDENSSTVTAQGCAEPKSGVVLLNMTLFSSLGSFVEDA